MDWLARNLLRWFEQHGRTDLPWQQNITPYRVWVSEIMLQQTQVATVIDYYQRFMARFPSVAELAAADLDEVLHLWTGLGYYARGRNLHKAAQQIVSEHNGEFPVGVLALTALPGIGPSTAGAIAAISQGAHAAILDGNVKRVLARFHGVDGYPGDTVTNKRLWHFANYHTPRVRTAHYTQAIMDLGATLCRGKQPDCASCPLQRRCEAYALDAVSQFPGKKAKKAKPVRAARMWLLVNARGACLLQRRPPTGLWGGLWTPPETDQALPLVDSCNSVATALGLQPEQLGEPEPLAPFRHTFTHYHLDLAPYRVPVQGQPNAPMVASDDQLLWYHPDDATEIGLAKPAVRLLAQL
ncbi:MAG: A/G-specific adenine glycosylase [Pseudomonadales bacterium]